jgi:hypothetical protein
VKIHIDGSALMRRCQLTWVDVSDLVKLGSELLVLRGEKLVRVLSEEGGSSAVPGAASHVGTSSERVDVPAVLSHLVRLDGKSLCLRQKQRLKIAAICSI